MLIELVKEMKQAKIFILFEEQLLLFLLFFSIVDKHVGILVLLYWKPSLLQDVLDLCLELLNNLRDAVLLLLLKAVKDLRAILHWLLDEYLAVGILDYQVDV
jgi:hypothetical protein